MCEAREGGLLEKLDEKDKGVVIAKLAGLKHRGEDLPGVGAWEDLSKAS